MTCFLQSYTLLVQVPVTPCIARVSRSERPQTWKLQNDVKWGSGAPEIPSFHFLQKHLRGPTKSPENDFQRTLKGQRKGPARETLINSILWDHEPVTILSKRNA
jgi:hypothetical protein